MGEGRDGIQSPVETTHEVEQRVISRCVRYARHDQRRLCACLEPLDGACEQETVTTELLQSFTAWGPPGLGMMHSHAVVV